MNDAFAKAAKTVEYHDYYKYRIAYTTDKDLSLLFIFITSLTDNFDNIKKELIKCKKEFVNLFGDILQHRFDAKTFEVFDPTIDSIHRNLRPKISLAGFSGVGKTTITRLIKAEEIPMQHIPTITGDIATIKIGKLHFHLWDFAGQEQFSYLWTNFIKGSDAVLLISDSTLENVEKSKFFLELIKEQAPHANAAVIGNKQDLPDALKPEQIEKLLGLKTYSMIANNSTNRDKMIQIIADVLEMSAEVSPLLKPLLERDKLMEEASNALENADFSKASLLFEKISDLCIELGDDSLGKDFFEKGQKIKEMLKKVGAVAPTPEPAPKSVPEAKSVPESKSIPEANHAPATMEQLPNLNGSGEGFKISEISKAPVEVPKPLDTSRHTVEVQEELVFTHVKKEVLKKPSGINQPIDSLKKAMTIKPPAKVEKTEVEGTMSKEQANQQTLESLASSLKALEALEEEPSEKLVKKAPVEAIPQPQKRTEEFTPKELQPVSNEGDTLESLALSLKALEALEEEPSEKNIKKAPSVESLPRPQKIPKQAVPLVESQEGPSIPRLPSESPKPEIIKPEMPQPEVLIKPAAIPMTGLNLKLNPEDFMIKQRPKTVVEVPKDAKTKLKTSPFAQVAPSVEAKVPSPVAPMELIKAKQQTPQPKLKASSKATFERISEQVVDSLDAIEPPKKAGEGTKKVQESEIAKGEPAPEPKIPVKEEIQKPAQSVIEKEPELKPTFLQEMKAPVSKTPAEVSPTINSDQKGDVNKLLMDLKIKKANIQKMALDFEMQELSGEMTTTQLEEKKKKLDVMEKKIEEQIRDLQKF